MERLVGSLIKESADASNAIRQKLKNKVLFLGPAPQRLNWIEKKKHKMLDRARMRNVISAKRRKEMKLTELEPEEKKYEDFIFMNEMWKQYITSVIPDTTRFSDNLCERVVKADLHGAEITVVQCKCPSMVDISGIILQESEKTFKIISKDNKIRTLIKKNTVFKIQIRSLEVLLYGNQFASRSADRATKKYKAKPTIDL